MEKKHLISVIIPTYNRGHLIKETLTSIKNQNHINWECIIIDDGSTDNTKKIVDEIIENDERFQYHLRPKAVIRGANACRNYGFSLSKGAYVKWFDSDDLMLPNMLQKQLDKLKGDDDVCFCECESFTMINNKRKKIKHFAIEYNNFTEDFILRKLLIQTGSGLWKRNFVKLIHFDESITQSQDYDFMTKALKNNPKINCLKEKLYYLRRGNNSITSEYQGFQLQHLNSYLKVKFNILNMFEKNATIKKGILNNMLSSLNLALNKKNTLAIKAHVKVLNQYFKNQEENKLKIKWAKIKVLTKLIMFFGKGAYKYRAHYKI